MLYPFTTEHYTKTVNLDDVLYIRYDIQTQELVFSNPKNYKSMTLDELDVQESYIGFKDQFMTFAEINDDFLLVDAHDVLLLIKKDYITEVKTSFNKIYFELEKHKVILSARVDSFKQNDGEEYNLAQAYALELIEELNQ